MTSALTLKDKSGAEFPAYVAKPDNGPVKGGVLVIHEVWGLADHIKDVANRLTQQGYFCLVPELLSDTSILDHSSEFKEIQLKLFDPKQSSEVQPRLREITAPLRDPGFASKTLGKLSVCVDYLVDKVGESVAVTGFCFGGTYSFSLAMSEPRLRAAAPFYGHCDHSVEELSRIKCPVQAFYGERDHNLVDKLPELEEKMKQAQVDFSYTVYPDCGHAFFNDTNSYAYNKEAATDAWNKLLAFLDAHLK